MRTLFKQTVRVLCVLSTALLVVGCIKIKQVVLVMPDGSGRMDITFGVNQAMMQGQEGAKDPTEIDIDQLDKESNGFVAFTKPKRTVANGWATVSLSAYFDDINAVKMDDNDGEEAKKSFVFAKSGDGYRLMIQQSMASDMTDNMNPDDVPAEQQSMMAAAMAGFELTESYTMPGKIKVANGYPQIKGRTAWVHIQDSDAMDAEKIKKLKPSGDRKVTCGPSEIDDEQVEAFKDELAAAKKQWEKIKAEAAQQ